MIIRGTFSKLISRYLRTNFMFEYWMLENNLKMITRLQKLWLHYIPMQERVEEGFILQYKTFRDHTYILGFIEKEQ